MGTSDIYIAGKPALKKLTPMCHDVKKNKGKKREEKISGLTLWQKNKTRCSRLTWMRHTADLSPWLIPAVRTTLLLSCKEAKRAPLTNLKDREMRILPDHVAPSRPPDYKARSCCDLAVIATNTRICSQVSSHVKGPDISFIYIYLHTYIFFSLLSNAKHDENIA